MYGTGKIGFWSLMEEGIGIVAGSLPALRPLLSLRVGFSSSVNTPGAATSGRSEPLRNTNNKHGRSRSAVMMETFQTLGDEEGEEEHEHDDGDSQKNIVKETKYSVTSTKVVVSEEERVRSQVLGWERALKN
jgi:hypothetical protein